MNNFMDYIGDGECKKKVIYAFALGIVCGLIVGFTAGWRFLNSDLYKIKMIEKELGELNIFDDGDKDKISSKEDISLYEIKVRDQKSGDIVSVDSVHSGKPVWVVIYEDMRGELGSILGAKFFDKGVNAGNIELLRSTVGDSLYYVVLQDDDGDIKFDYTKDLPIKDDKGNIIMMKFKTLSVLQ